MISSPTRSKSRTPVQIIWSHLGLPYRVTAWPEVQFEVFRDDRWISFDPNPASEVFAAAANQIPESAWARYLDFIPAIERRLLERFKFQRLAALATITRCPELIADLQDAPALVGFVAAHAELRGTPLARWTELNAINERSGIYGVMEWLGLPASRRTLDALAELSDVDLPKRLLTRMREALWNPIAGEFLHHVAPHNDRELAMSCETLAA